MLIPKATCGLKISWKLDPKHNPSMGSCSRLVGQFVMTSRSWLGKTWKNMEKHGDTINLPWKYQGFSGFPVDFFHQPPRGVLIRLRMEFVILAPKTQEFCWKSEGHQTLFWWLLHNHSAIVKLGNDWSTHLSIWCSSNLNRQLFSQAHQGIKGKPNEKWLKPQFEPIRRNIFLLWKLMVPISRDQGLS